MPFQSRAQLGFLYAKHPAIAKRWAKKYGVPKNLPKKAVESAMKDRIKKV